MNESAVTRGFAALLCPQLAMTSTPREIGTLIVVILKAASLIITCVLVGSDVQNVCLETSAE